MGDFLKNAMRQWLYSVLFGEWQETPTAPPVGFLMVYADSDGLHWMSSNGEVNYLLSVQNLSANNPSGDTQFGVDGLDAAYQFLQFRDNALNMWSVGSDDDVKSGGNNGKDFVIKYHDNDGAVVGECLRIFRANATFHFQTPVLFGANVGFFGTSPTTKPTVTGSRGGNAALASLLTAGATLGLWIDSTT